MPAHEPFSPAFDRDLVLDTDRLDQHLLADQNALSTLLDTAQLGPDDLVADLGAGTGVITRALAESPASRIYAIELDSRFAPYLDPIPRACAHVDLIWGDVLGVDLRDVTKVVSNPPFRLTERLLAYLCRIPSLTYASLIMGMSFGTSATAMPGSRHYNRLSLKAQAGFDVHLIGSLPPHSFYPPAGGPACIVRLARRRSPSVDATVDQAMTHMAGVKVKDLLWSLEHRSSTLGPLPVRRHIIRSLRRTSAVQRVYQQRLQRLTSMELSRFMAELHRLVGLER